MRLNRGVVGFFVLIALVMIGGAVAMWLGGDGTDPGADMGALILGGIGAFYLVLMMILWLIVRRQGRLVRGGVPAMATILSVRDSGTMVNNQPRLVLEVEITPQNGQPPYRFETKKVVGHSSLAMMRPGVSLPVSVDPRRPERFAFIDGQQYASIGGAASATASPPGSVTIPPQDRSPADDRVGRLERLAALHASGALSDDEFAAEKQRLLGER